MDYREWDDGSRLPRDRRFPDVAGATPPGEQTGLRETPQTWGTGSVADTGSMEPIPDAVAWAMRADAWAQPGGAEQAGPWSDAATRTPETPARPAFPPDGIGWRSTTSEWRSTTEAAQWRATTEWRSGTGGGAYRSTVEAQWQTSDGGALRRPPVEPPTRQPAISGTAWPTPPDADQQPYAADQGAEWGHSQAAAGQWQPPAGGNAIWQQTGAGRAQPAAEPPTPQTYTGSWAPSSGLDPARHLVREDDRARWSRENPGGTAHRRTADPVVPYSSTGWSGGADADNWAGHTDTGSLTVYGGGDTWRGSEGGSRRAEAVAPGNASWSAAQPADPWAPQAGGAPTRDAGGRRRRTPADDTGPWSADASGDVGPGASRWASAPGSGWAAGSATGSSSWSTAGSTGWSDDAGRRGVPAAGDSGSWLEPADTTGSWRGPAEDTGSWRGPAEDTAGWRGSDATAGSGGDAARWSGGGRGAYDVPSNTETGSRAAPRAAGTYGTGGVYGSAASGGASVGGSAAIGPGPDVGDLRDDWRSGDRQEPAARRGEAVETWRAEVDRAGLRAPSRDPGAWRSDPGPDTYDPDRTGYDQDTRRISLAVGDGTGDRWTGAYRDDELPRAGEGTRRIPYGDDAYADDPSPSGYPDRDWSDTRARSGGYADEERGRTPDDPWNASRTGDRRQPGRAAGAFTDGTDRRRAAADGVGPDGGRRNDSWGSDPDLSGDRVEPGSWRPDADDYGRGRADAGSWRAELAAEIGTEDREPDDREPDNRRPDDRRSSDRGRDDRWDRRAADPRDPWQENGGRPRDDAPPARGTASYRGSASTRTTDWRRELAAENGLSDLAPGESRRFTTDDFPPHRGVSGRPAGTARVGPRPSARAVGAARPVSPVDWAGGGGDELLVPRRAGSWQEPPSTTWPPRGVGGGSGSYERRPVGTLTRPVLRPIDEPDDELEEAPGGIKAALGYTVIWYSVPVVLFLLYMLVLDPGQRVHAFETLVSGAPQFGLSLLLSLPVAVGLRWVSGTWKAASVGLAAAVMGGGLATVLLSAITDQSL